MFIVAENTGSVNIEKTLPLGSLQICVILLVN